MKTPEPKPRRFWRWFYELMRFPVGTFYRWKYQLQGENSQIAWDHRGPALIIPNHVTIPDPFLVSLFFRIPIAWVASDANFRNKTMAFLLSLVGTIPIAKRMGDTSTIKDMMMTLKSGKGVGIFGEGERTWDGNTLPLLPATYKLIRMAKVPVFVPIIKGGYMALPRWANKPRRGPITIEIRQALNSQEAATFSLEQITERMNQVFQHREEEYLTGKGFIYQSTELAQPIELILFRCPQCGGYQTITSRGKTFSCTSCKASWELTYTAVITGTTSTTISQWLEQQRQAMASDKSSAPPNEIIFSDDNVDIWTGYRDNPMKPLGKGRVGVSPSGMYILDQFHEWNQIKSMNVVFQNQVDFYVNDTLYSLKLTTTSGYKYQEFFRLI